MRKLAAAGWVLLATALLLLAGRAITPTMGSGTLELRVIGASNLAHDQAVKLQVRDAVLALLAPGLAQAPDAAAADAYVAQRLPDVQKVAQAVAGRAGQTVHVHLGMAPLPARQIGLLTFPAGTAPTLVVTLGAGQGHNWFTVLFPPLALVTVDGHLVAVGPDNTSSARALTPAERRALLAWVSGQTGVILDPDVSAQGSGGDTGAKVQVRFMLWDLARDVASWIGSASA